MKHQKRLHEATPGGDLRAARRGAGLTQADIAARIGCSLPAVRQAECSAGSLPTLLSLAAELGLAPGGRSLPPGACLGARLAVLRTRKGLGRREAAALAGMSPTTVATIEGGGACHTAAVAGLAAAFGASLRLVPTTETEGFWTGAAASTAHHGWTTPPAVLEALYPLVGGCFGLDPCSPVRKGASAPVRARMRFTDADDGLAMHWTAESVFMNPPYGRSLGRWVAKAGGEHAAGRARLVIALVPARPDTRWWHGHVVRQSDVWMLKGRLAFGDGSAPAPFPSAIVAWGAEDAHRHGMARAFPDAWHVPAAHAEAGPD